MARLLKTTVLAIGLIGFALPVTVAEAAPFHHKVCHTTWRHHHKHTSCHWVMFRKHPIRSTLHEFIN